MIDLAGRVALVTGSAVGIGRAVCLALAERGAAVAALDIDAANNADTAAQVRATGRPCQHVTVDVGDAARVKKAVGEIASELGRLDVLVNNAAVWTDTTLTAGTYESQTAELARSWGSCAAGAFHCAAAAVPIMRSLGGGEIVNLITEHIRPHRLITGAPATGYDCAKFAQWRLTESWAVELAPLGIRVNGLAFGATDTPMLRAVSARIAAAGMRAEDMATAVLNILDQGPAGPTGRVYDVGFTGTPRETSLEQIAAIAHAAG